MPFQMLAGTDIAVREMMSAEIQAAPETIAVAIAGRRPSHQLAMPIGIR